MLEKAQLQNCRGGVADLQKQATDLFEQGRKLGIRGVDRLTLLTLGSGRLGVLDADHQSAFRSVTAPGQVTVRLRDLGQHEDRLGDIGVLLPQQSRAHGQGLLEKAAGLEELLAPNLDPTQVGQQGSGRRVIAGHLLPPSFQRGLIQGKGLVQLALLRGAGGLIESLLQARSPVRGQRRDPLPQRDSRRDVLGVPIVRPKPLVP